MNHRTALIFAAVLLLASAPVDACSAVLAARGQPEPIDPVPYAVFEARVIEVHDAGIQLLPDSRPEMIANGQEGIIEVIRSFHGPLKPGQRVPISTVTGGGSCGIRVTIGTRTEIWSNYGPPFKTWSEALYDGDQPSSVFAELALVSGPGRHSHRAELANVTIRGHLSDGSAAKLLLRAKPVQEGCSIIRAAQYAEVLCGEAFDGNDAAFKVIFERAGSRWIEVMRWEAPGPA